MHKERFQCAEFGIAWISTFNFVGLLNFQEIRIHSLTPTYSVSLPVFRIVSNNSLEDIFEVTNTVLVSISMSTFSTLSTINTM